MLLNRRKFAAYCLAGLALNVVHAEESKPLQTASLAASPASASVPTPSEEVVELSGRKALDFQITRLESMLRTLSLIDDYKAKFVKQERVGGDLSRETKIDLKFRHGNDETGAPTSIYMKWLSGDKGREVIFVDGQNNGKILVHAGGWRARILPVLSLDPTGSLAMGESRHPITEAGLMNLTEKWLTVRRQDRKHAGMTFGVEPAEFDGCSGYKFTVEYSDPLVSKIYRKCELWIDDERNIPVASVNYTWDGRGNDDDNTLVERYEYRDLELNVGLADIDFDRKNEQYTFRK